MPTILRQYGYRFFFYSGEDREPPHVHVIGHGGEMKVWIVNISVAKTYRLSPQKQKRVLKIVEENKELLLNAWREFHGRTKNSRS